MFNYDNKMTRTTISVRVLLYTNQNEFDWDDLTSRELDAIVNEIHKMWPPDIQSRVWFDVEKRERIANGQWETIVRVSCYHMPIHDKSQCAEIPKVYTESLVGRKIRIFPITDQDGDNASRGSAILRRLEMQLVEVLYVLE